MFWSKIQRDGWKCILFVSLLSLGQSPLEAQQDVVLTMTSGEQCFGSRVTLLCTHPDPFADSVKYIQQTINWAEDGTVIDFTDPSGKRFTPTRLNSTASTLSFTVTEEDYRDREITYACFLVLNNANRDREESKAITMDALEKPLPPSIAPAPPVHLTLYHGLMTRGVMISAPSLTSSLGTRHTLQVVHHPLEESAQQRVSMT